MKHSSRIKFINYFTILVRLILGIIFIAAGIPKILDPSSFAMIVYSYQLLPDIFINFFALVLPWLEVIVGGFLILGIWLPGTVVLYNLLMLSFMSALVVNTFRGLDVQSGCFSTDSEGVININTILRDAGILLMAMYLFFMEIIRKWPELKLFGKPVPHIE
jgi:putative oxidoreductase